MGFAGRTAMVTGAARGIGQAIAHELAARGVRVLVTDIDEAAARQAAVEIGAGARAFPLDVTKQESWEAARADIIEAWGQIDILVNNAGIAGRSAPLWEYSYEEWNQVIAIDLNGIYLGCRTMVPQMRAAHYGRIVNIASIAGKEGNPNASAYSAAKAGVIGLTKSLAKEVAQDGILVNAVTPAVIHTDILQQVSEEHVAYMTSRIPMGRLGQPEEVAKLVAFLASDDLTFSTGAVFDISGGRATY